MILHKEDFDAIRDLIKEEVDKALIAAALSKVKADTKAEPAKKEEKK